jgi:hypothetical protein
MILFEQPWFLLSLLALGFLFWLYLRQPRRRKQIVSQVFLYLRARKEVLTRFHRLRFFRNLIFFLQCLAILLLGTASALPLTGFYPLLGSRAVLVLDGSLSMMTEDVEPNRWEQARERARQLGRTLLADGGEVAVWALDQDPHLVLDFTLETGDLDRALSELAPSFLAPTPAELLLDRLDRWAGERLITVYLISDMAFEIPPAIKINHLALRPQPIGTPCGNLAIVDASWQLDRLWLKVANFSDQPRTIRLAVGENTSIINLEAEEIGQLEFQQTPTTSVLPIRLMEEDLLPWDNRLDLTVPLPPRVLLISSSPFLESALEAAGNNVVTIGPEDYRPEISADLIVFEDFLPSSLPARPMLVIHPPMNNSVIPWTETASLAIPQARADPLLRFVDLSQIRFQQVPLLEPPVGLTSVVWGGKAGILWKGVLGDQRTALLAPSLSSSSWPLEPTFPVFLANVVRWLMGDDLLYSPNDVGSGILIEPFNPSYQGKGTPWGLYGIDRADGLNLYTVAQPNEQESNLQMLADVEQYGLRSAPPDLLRPITAAFLMAALIVMALEEVLRKRYG